MFGYSLCSSWAQAAPQMPILPTHRATGELAGSSAPQGRWQARVLWRAVASSATPDQPRVVVVAARVERVPAVQERLLPAVPTAALPE